MYYKFKAVGSSDVKNNRGDDKTGTIGMVDAATNRDSTTSTSWERMRNLFTRAPPQMAVFDTNSDCVDAILSANMPTTIITSFSSKSNPPWAHALPGTS